MKIVRHIVVVIVFDIHVIKEKDYEVYFFEGIMNVVVKTYRKGGKAFIEEGNNCCVQEIIYLGTVYLKITGID